MTRAYFSTAIVGLAFCAYSLGSGRNLLLNPNFEVDTSAWVVDPGTSLSHVPDEGDLTPDGAAQLEGGADLGEEGVLFARLFQCH